MRLVWGVLLFATLAFSDTAPVLNPSSQPLNTSATGLTIYGSNFGPTPSSNTVHLTSSGGSAPTASVSAASSTSLTLTFNGPLSADLQTHYLSATVTVGTLSSASQTITAEITLGAPVLNPGPSVVITTTAKGFTVYGQNFNSNNINENIVTITTAYGHAPTATVTMVHAEGDFADVVFGADLNTDIVGTPLLMTWTTVSSTAAVAVTAPIVLDAPLVLPDVDMAFDTNALTLTVNGRNFNSVSPGTNTVVITSDAPSGTRPTGVVTSVNYEGTQAVVSLNTQGVGVYTAVDTALVNSHLSLVLYNGMSSSSPAVIVTDLVQLALPVVIQPTLDVLDTNALTCRIYGRNFAVDPKTNYVNFTSSVGTPPMAIVTQVDNEGTKLTVSFADRFDTNLKNGVLSVVVTNPTGTSGAPTPISKPITLGLPTVSPSQLNLYTNDQTILVQGTNFDPNPLGNVVTFTASGGSPPVGTTTAVSGGGTVLTVTIQGRLNTNLVGQQLSVVVKTSAGLSGNPVNVTASVRLSVPTVRESSTTKPDTNTQDITITGTNFNTIPGANTVVMSVLGSGTAPTGTVTAVGGGGTTAVITITGRLNTNLVNSQLEVVLDNGVGASGAAVLVTGPIQLAPPTVVQLALAVLDTDATTVTIGGTNFDASAPQNQVTFMAWTSGTAPTGTVVAVQGGGTLLVVLFAGRLNTDLMGEQLAATVITAAGTSGGAVLVTKPIALAAPTVSIATPTLTIDTDATDLTIYGTNFHPIVAMNLVNLTALPTGTAPAVLATGVFGGGTQLVVHCQSRLDTDLVGNLLAAVVTTWSGASNRAAITTKFLLALPTVTPSTIAIDTEASVVTVTGTNFAMLPDDNRVIFTSSSGSAPTGEAIRVGMGGTLMVIEFPTDLNTNLKGATLGLVIINDGGTSVQQTITGQIALAPPQVNVGVSPINTDTLQIQISGRNFEPIAGANTVQFHANAGTAPAGSVTTILGGGTIAIIAFGARLNTNLVGHTLSMSLTTSAGSTPMVVVVASISLSAPIVMSTNLAVDSNAMRVTISGHNFDQVPTQNLVTFFSSGSGTPPAATTTAVYGSGDTLSVLFRTRLNTNLEGQSLSVVVATGAGASDQVTVTLPITLAPPTVTVSTQPFATDDTQLTIAGTNFAALALGNNVTVYSMAGAGRIDGQVMVPLGATGTLLVVIIARLSTDFVGTSLGVIVNTDAGSSGIVSVTGPIALSPPQVTENDVATIDTDNTTLTISGFNFDKNPAANTVQLFATGGANAPTATVIGVTAGGTLATVQFSQRLDTNLVGESLQAVWTTTAGSSPSLVTVVRVKLAVPRVTTSAVALTTDSERVTITGFNFDATATNNNVTFLAPAGGTAPLAVASSVGGGGTTLSIAFTGRLDTNLKGQTLQVSVLTSAGSSNPTTCTGPIALGPPTLTVESTVISTDATQLVVVGTNFEPLATDNHIVKILSSAGTPPTGTVTGVLAGGTEAVISFIGQLGPDLKDAFLSVSITTSAGTTPVTPVTGPIVLGAPVLSTTGLALTTDATTFTIAGKNFDVDVTKDTVVIVPSKGTAPTATVHSVGADGNSAVVVFTSPLTSDLEGATLAVSFNNSISASAPQTVTVPLTIGVPVLMWNTLNLTTASTTFTVSGRNFDQTLTQNTLTFTVTGPACATPTGTVQSVNSAGTEAVVVFTNPGGLLDTACVGSALQLTLANPTAATPATNVVHSITLAAPTLVMDSTTLIALTTDDTQLVLNGTSFAAGKTQNFVTFGVDADHAHVTLPTGSVSAVRLGGQQLVITFDSGPLSASLKGAVLSVTIANGVGDTGAVAISEPIVLGVPVVLPLPVLVDTNTTAAYITGRNFDPAAANNMVVVTSDGGTPPSAVLAAVDANGFTAWVTFEGRLNTDLVNHKLSVQLVTSGGSSTPTVLSGPIALSPPTLDGLSTPVEVDTDARELRLNGTNFDHDPAKNTIVLTVAQGTAPAAQLTAVRGGGNQLVISFAERLDTDVAGQSFSLVIDNGVASFGPVAVTRPIMLAAPTVVEAYPYLDTTSGGFVINGTNFNANPDLNNVSFTAQVGTPPLGRIVEVGHGGQGVYVEFVGGLAADLAQSNLSVVFWNGVGFSDRTTVSAEIVGIAGPSASSKTGIIVGLVVGVVAVIGIGIGCFVWSKRRKQRGGKWQKVGVVDGVGLLDKDDDDDLSTTRGPINKK